MRDGEFFGVDVVGTGSFKHLNSPLHSALHRRCTGHATPYLVGQSTQIALKRGWLQGNLDNPGCIVALGRSHHGKTDGAQHEASPEGFQVSHIGCIRNEILEKSKSSSRNA
jgi:hypothetical protein